MIKRLLTTGFCVMILLAGASFAAAQTEKNILGLYVGMDRVEAGKVLQKIGKKDNDERKQQEIWNLIDNKHFSHIIVAFDREYKKIRFVTAKAREDGRVRYSNVIDPKKAVVQNLANNYKYVLEIPARENQAGFKIIAAAPIKII